MLIAGAATLALGAAACTPSWSTPTTRPRYPQCPLKALTGIDCPGCGGLRATHALLHGDILGAADHNLLALILLPLMAVHARPVGPRSSESRCPPSTWPTPFVWITPLVLVAFTVVRNIPVAGLRGSTPACTQRRRPHVVSPGPG